MSCRCDSIDAASARCARRGRCAADGGPRPAPSRRQVAVAVDVGVGRAARRWAMARSPTGPRGPREDCRARARRSRRPARSGGMLAGLDAVDSVLDVPVALQQVQAPSGSASKKNGRIQDSGWARPRHRQSPRRLKPGIAWPRESEVISWRSADRSGPGRRRRDSAAASMPMAPSRSGAAVGHT